MIRWLRNTLRSFRRWLRQISGKPRIPRPPKVHSGYAAWCKRPAVAALAARVRRGKWQCPVRDGLGCVSPLRCSDALTCCVPAGDALRAGALARKAKYPRLGALRRSA